MAKIAEIAADIFAEPTDRFYVHCISGDYALQGEMAQKFDERFSLGFVLNNTFPTEKDYQKYLGRALQTGQVYNLVVKDRSKGRADYRSIRMALMDLRNQCYLWNRKKLAFSKPSFVADGLNWNSLLVVIEDVFLYKDVDILIYEQ